MKSVIIHTDGACKGNPGIGGWGALLRYGDRERKLHGGERDTTNNRMEMTAAIRALEALREPCEVTLYTDSTYLRQGILSWMPDWKRRNWKTAAGKPVKNQDLWQALDQAARRHRVNWQWVKGHAGDPGNEEADRLANLGVDEMRAAIAREADS